MWFENAKKCSVDICQVTNSHNFPTSCLFFPVCFVIPMHTSMLCNRAKMAWHQISKWLCVKMSWHLGINDMSIQKIPCGQEGQLFCFCLFVFLFFLTRFSFFLNFLKISGHIPPLKIPLISLWHWVAWRPYKVLISFNGQCHEEHARDPLKCEQNIVRKFMCTLDDILDEGSKF